MTTETEVSWSDAIGRPSFEAIKEMVRALDIDMAAEDYAAELPVERCVELLKEAGAEFDDIDSVEDLRVDVASNIADGTIKPDDFKFDEDEARQEIEEDPLSLQVRSDWHSPGDESEDVEYELLLSTGGPAVRIVGDLCNGEPTSATSEVQDWFKPWTPYYEADSNDVLMRYVSCFCFSY